MEKRKYQALIIPKLTWTKNVLTNSFGELIAQPLEPGFGITLGNALRRILLGGIEGSAVTSVVIDGVNNEFSMITGVVEDTMQLLLNIKGIIIRNNTGQSGKMSLRVIGQSVARVSDIKADAHLELINPGHILANVSHDGVLAIDFFVESGRGYKRAQWPIGEALQKDGRIYLDAMFSPIKKVMFDVEKTRVGGDIDHDKLILRIHTNGSENPLDMLHYSVSVLKSQLEHFLSAAEIPFNQISPSIIEEHTKETVRSQSVGLNGISPELLLRPIDELELSVRAHNCLITAGIKRIIDLVSITEEETLKIKNFGRKSLAEVKESMSAFGLSFGMKIKEEDVKFALESRE
jgi:DNA-directed RNA polymerase subunit alpha